MIFYRTYCHDLRCGLLRWRFLFVPIIILFPLIDFYIAINRNNLSFTCMDIVFYLFQGTFPASYRFFPGDRIELPLTWIYLLGNCLIFNLDYMINDLSLNGQQIIMRCGSRRIWFASKCVWNISSTLLYFCCLFLSVSFFSLICGGGISFDLTPEVCALLLGVAGIDILPKTQIILSGIVLPFLTLMTLNIVEMVLCHFVGVIFSFLICMGMLLLVVLYDNPFLLGCGAMAIRTITNYSVQWTLLKELLVITLTILGAVIIGAIQFNKVDILPEGD